MCQSDKETKAAGSKLILILHLTLDAANVPSFSHNMNGPLNEGDDKVTRFTEQPRSSLCKTISGQMES